MGCSHRGTGARRGSVGCQSVIQSPIVSAVLLICAAIFLLTPAKCIKSIHAVNKNNSRWIAPVLSRALSVFPVVVVAGARQVGKTTLVRDLCPGPKRK